MAIREATIEDALGIAKVQVKTWQSAYRGIVSDDYLESMSTDKSACGWANFFSDTNKFAFVALDRLDTVVGFASGGDNRKSLNLLVRCFWKSATAGRFKDIIITGLSCSLQNLYIYARHLIMFRFMLFAEKIQ